MQYAPMQWQSKAVFGEWLNTAPKHQVLPYLRRALSNAKRLGDEIAVAHIQVVINQVESEE